MTETDTSREAVERFVKFLRGDLRTGMSLYEAMKLKGMV